jgi:hypothetical protein
MAIQTTFYHPDRLVIGIFEGGMKLKDFLDIALEIRKNNVVHYRKIINVIDAYPEFTEQELMALVQVLRETPTGPRGPVAFVADMERGEFARLFSQLEVGGRPAQVFRSIHDARKWLSTVPSVPEP